MSTGTSKKQLLHSGRRRGGGWQPVLGLVSMLAGMSLLTPATADEPLSTVEQTRQLCRITAEQIADGSYEEAFAALGLHWPLPKADLDRLAEQTRSMIAVVGERFGAPIGAEFVRTIEAGQSLVGHVFLMKHEKHALKLSCVFYRPREAWLVNAVLWDDKPRSLLDLVD